MKLGPVSMFFPWSSLGTGDRLQETYICLENVTFKGHVAEFTARGPDTIVFNADHTRYTRTGGSSQ